MEPVKHPIVPKSVTSEELNAALEPLYRLLGISAHWVYSEPGMTIDHDRIRLMVVPGQLDSYVGGPAGLRHLQDDEFSELMCFVEVKIEQP